MGCNNCTGRGGGGALHLLQRTPREAQAKGGGGGLGLDPPDCEAKPNPVACCRRLG